MWLLALPEPLFDALYSPVLYDRKGELLGALAAQDGQWRFPPGEKPSEKFTAALIESEDRRFFYHPGLDPLALVRAFSQMLKNRRVISGASTLTMQTVRLMRPGMPRTFLEKAVEAVLALRLELGRSKEDILALYTANAPFGANVVGLEAAAWRWFGRPPEDLSWAEAATLAVLPKSPGLIHPGRNREALKRKRDVLLETLWKRNYFDEETLNLAKAESLPGKALPLPRLAPHLLNRLITEAGGLGAFRSGTRAAASTGKSGGLPGPLMGSTLDRALQERAQTVMNRALTRFAGNGIMNGACLILNTRNGEVLAYVGNVDSSQAPDVDIVTARRSSGSILKPFLYAAMLDSGDILPRALLTDIPTRVGSYSPENISRNYLGAVPADEALARSLNIPAVRSLRIFGVDRFARFLRGLGISTLFRPGNEYGLPLILGGAEVTLWEMAGMYAGLGRSALAGNQETAFYHPRVFPAPPGEKPESARPGPLSRGAAWLTLDALTFAVRPGEEARWQEYANSRRIAWKTGTSFGFRDAWAIGLTPDWTVAVWIGNASGEGRAELRSSVTSAPVLFELFSALASLSPGGNPWFSQPAAELKTQEVCAFSGYPAGPDCGNIRYVFLPQGAPPHSPCSYCRTVVLNEKEDRRVIPGPGYGKPVVMKKWFTLSPAEEWYYRKWNLDYKPLPPWENDPAGDLPLGSTSLALFNPQPGAQIFVPRELDGREGRIVFAAAHRNPGGKIYWHLDNRYLGMTEFFHEIESRPGPGFHTLYLVDTQGGALTRRFEVLENQD
jgi:penicillin-binding protein 1C